MAKAKIEVEVTQELIDKNPSFAENEGVSVGDMLSLTEKEAKALEAGESTEKVEDEPEEETKKVGGRAIVNKGGTAILREKQEFIRVYPADTDKESVASFVGKDPKYSTMPADDISAVIVEYEATKPDPVRAGEQIFYRKEEKYTRADHGDEMFALALVLRNEKRGVIKIVKGK
jgi:hypothetical protein